jgi:hypothetical protein
MDPCETCRALSCSASGVGLRTCLVPWLWGADECKRSFQRRPPACVHRSLPGMPHDCQRRRGIQSTADPTRLCLGSSTAHSHMPRRSMAKWSQETRARCPLLTRRHTRQGPPPHPATSASLISWAKPPGSRCACNHTCLLPVTILRSCAPKSLLGKLAHQLGSCLP